LSVSCHIIFRLCAKAPLNYYGEARVLPLTCKNVSSSFTSRIYLRAGIIQHQQRAICGRGSIRCFTKIHSEMPEREIIADNRSRGDYRALLAIHLDFGSVRVGASPLEGLREHRSDRASKDAACQRGDASLL